MRGEPRRHEIIKQVEAGMARSVSRLDGLGREGARAAQREHLGLDTPMIGRRYLELLRMQASG